MSDKKQPPEELDPMEVGLANLEELTENIALKNYIDIGKKCIFINAEGQPEYSRTHHVQYFQTMLADFTQMGAGINPLTGEKAELQE